MAQKQVAPPHSQLRCAPHTTYYSNLFVLKTTVAINEQQAEIGFSEDGELTLNCRYPSTKCLTLNYHTISAELEGIFRKYGVNHVNNCWCVESVLYFQVSFRSQECLCTFLRSQGSTEEELSILLSHHPPKSETACTPLLCKVETKLFLITVDTQKKEAQMNSVSESNHTRCLTIWRESAIFEFGSFFRACNHEFEIDLANDEIDLPQLETELENVVEWFGLGMHLGVPHTNLLEIKADHQGITRGQTAQCKRAMFIWWLGNREVSWLAVVRALEKIKMAGLAQKIATKYSVSDLSVTDKEQPSFTESNHERTDKMTTAALVDVSMLQVTDQDQVFDAEKFPSTPWRDHEKVDELTTAASSLNDEMGKKLSLGKRRAQEELDLNESSAKIIKLANEKEERRIEIEKKEQELNLYTQLLQELKTQKDIECLKVKIAKKNEKIKQLKAQLHRVEKELSQAREECKQQRERIQQTTVELAVQCEKTRNLERTVAELKRERKEKDRQLMLSVAKNQVHLSELHANMDKEVDSLKQEVKEKNSTIRALSSQLEVKEAEEKELEEGQLAQMAAEISHVMARLEEAEDGKMRAEEELKDLQYLQQTETQCSSTDISYPLQQFHSASFEAPPTSSQSLPARVNVSIERGQLGFGFSLEEEIEEKDGTIRELSRQLEVKEAEEQELEEGQLAQMTAEISELTTKLDWETEDGKMRAEEELKDLQNQAETLWPNTDISYPYQQHHSASFEALQSAPSLSQSDRVNINIERGPHGFGFTLGKSPNGPVVKQIMDHSQCGQLKEGDIILEVNGESTHNYLHSELITMLEECLQATFTIQSMPPQPERQQAEIPWPNTDISCPYQQPNSTSFETPPTSSQPNRENVYIVKGPLGFGFALGESPNGPVVKQIVYHPRCAQLKEGDVILEVNGEKVHNYPHLVKTLKQYPMGKQATFTILRMPPQPVPGLDTINDQPQHMMATPTDNYGKPVTVLSMSPQPEENNQPALKQIVVESTSSLLNTPYEEILHIEIHRPGSGFRLWQRRSDFGFVIANGTCLHVKEITEGGAAEKDGRLRVGDELLEINGKPTEGMLYSDAIANIKHGGKLVKLVVRRESYDSICGSIIISDEEAEKLLRVDNDSHKSHNI